MAIVFENKKYKITVDSKTIIGVMGEEYDKFLSSLEGDNVFYLDKKISVGKIIIMVLLVVFNIN